MVCEDREILKVSVSTYSHALSTPYAKQVMQADMDRDVVGQAVLQHAGDGLAFLGKAARKGIDELDKADPNAPKLMAAREASTTLVKGTFLPNQHKHDHRLIEATDYALDGLLGDSIMAEVIEESEAESG